MHLISANRHLLEVLAHSCLEIKNTIFQSCFKLDAPGMLFFKIGRAWYEFAGGQYVEPKKCWEVK
jgi:hypothetical protein